jgi:transposase InsO family protein
LASAAASHITDPGTEQPLRRRLDGPVSRGQAIAKALIAQAVEQQQIKPGTLTVHADRGSSMTSKPFAFLLADLGLTRTHNRPYTSTDNLYSEAPFKTLKHRPEFPDRFQNIGQACGYRRLVRALQPQAPPLRHRADDRPMPCTMVTRPG